MFRTILNEMMTEYDSRRIPYEDILGNLQSGIEIEHALCRMDWRFVRVVLGNMKKIGTNADYFLGVFNYLVQLFNEHKCRDSSVITDVFQLASFVFESTPACFRKAQSLIDFMKKNIPSSELRSLNYVAKLRKMPYKSDDSEYISHFDVIQMNIISSESQRTRNLLTYGVMYIPLGDSRSTWAHCRTRMWDLLQEAERPKLLQARTMYANFMQYNVESRRRMLAVFRGVETILKARVPGNFLNNFGLCLRMAFETIPEPFITSQEVKAFLKLCFGPSSDDLIQNICNFYEEVFPESLKPRRPRSLKHLSRVQARQNLREAGQLPHGIPYLNIPDAIEKYIAEVDNEYIRTQFNGCCR